MYTNRVFRTAKGVLHSEVSSFQGVLIREVPLYTVQSILRAVCSTEPRKPLKRGNCNTSSLPNSIEEAGEKRMYYILFHIHINPSNI